MDFMKNFIKELLWIIYVTFIYKMSKINVAFQQIKFLMNIFQILYKSVLLLIALFKISNGFNLF